MTKKGKKARKTRERACILILTTSSGATKTRATPPASAPASICTTAPGSARAAEEKCARA
jgi:hypothetical protein